MLSDSEGSDLESLHEITINEHYAKAFEYRKEREELQKLKEKYGSDFEDESDESTDSESDESEDEVGEELTPTVDAAILRTLARIKRKDPDIYDTDKNIFGEEQKKIAPIAKPSRTPKDKSKPITMRQVALESALNTDSRSPSPQPLPHVEEQRALRDETIAAFHHAIDDEEGEDSLLIPREKTKGEQEKEEEEYKAFLEREVGGDLRELVTIDVVEAEQVEEDGAKVADKGKQKEKKIPKSDKAQHSGKSKEEADQEFLMNYILNRGWIDRSVNHIPTYNEITSSKSKSKGKQKQEETLNSDLDSSDNENEKLPTADSDLDEDDFEEIVDRFESSYNFRFEEPDGSVIKSYPRSLPSLVRREDTTRKDARKRRKERKEEELLKRKEEVKRLKGLKMKEIRSKLETIGREGGIPLNDSSALQELDLDGEWDPEAHDQHMARLYEDDDAVDDEKPQWNEDIDIGDIIEAGDKESAKKSKKKKKKKKDQDTDMDQGVDIDAMDADVERTVDDEEWDGTEEMRKRKLDEYMNEIYELDFNDLIGDMPTRFKYIPVQPQNFGLAPVEILMANDQELNEYMSVKKYAPYRKQVKWDSTRNDRLKEFKSKVSEKISSEMIAGTSWDGADKPAKKRKGKKERLKLKAAGADEDRTHDAKASGALVPEISPETSKRKRPSADVDGEGNSKGEEGAHEKKKRRRKKKGVGSAGVGVNG